MSDAFQVERWGEAEHECHRHPLLPFAYLRSASDLNPDRPEAWDWWRAESSTGYDELDSELGRAYANLALDCARKHNTPLLVAWILAAMLRKGHHGYVEDGFMDRISRAATAGVAN